MAPRSRGKDFGDVGQQAERRGRGSGDEEEAGAEAGQQRRLQQQRCRRPCG